MNARKVALPKTYHQPVRGGTGCASTPRAQVSRPVRSSNAARSRPITPDSSERNRTRENLHLPGPHPHWIARERLGWGTAGDTAVGVVHAAVAGAEEKLGVGEPPHRAAKMGAVDRERGEAALVVPPEPRRSAGTDARPGQRGRVLERYAHGFADLEPIHRPYPAPLTRGLPGEGREQKAHDRHADHRGSGRGEEDRDAGEEATPFEQLGVVRCPRRGGRGVVACHDVHVWLGRG